MIKSTITTSLTNNLYNSIAVSLKPNTHYIVSDVYAWNDISAAVGSVTNAIARITGDRLTDGGIIYERKTLFPVQD